MDWRKYTGFGFVALFATTVAAAWRVYTYMKYTQPEMWFTNPAWAMNTFSVYGGILGVLVLWIIMIKLHDYLSDIDCAASEQVETAEEPKEKEEPTKLDEETSKKLSEFDKRIKDKKPTVTSEVIDVKKEEKKPKAPSPAPKKKKTEHYAPVKAAPPPTAPTTPIIQQKTIVKGGGGGCFTCLIWIVGFIAALIALKFILVAWFGHAVLDMFGNFMR